MKKIMFNDKYGLTTAVLNGNKTMTRRMVQKKYLLIYEDMSRLEQPCYPMEEWLIRRASPYKIGEVVAVAQAYKDIIGDHVWLQSTETGVSIHVGVLKKTGGFGNKMFVQADLMPRHIRITDIKVERLKDISDEDCMAEGIKKKSDFPRKKFLPFYFEGGKHGWDHSFRTPRAAFAALIDKVSGKGTWDRNPWVFAYTFELERRTRP